ncbi:rhomboid family intramembrane serine protease [Streptantibioticus rubrisoli]|uniref:Rhomboid family intramembrane serine protease n=1 Tax=Streptantibioticus rubrisoli TaxID=1387313 RepID=A0ABT1PLN2_9ACTN|nr:rhomboid family intramembrane serine protease [Streptantibioticus rubrisoli]MCQ4046244.1 rhomboid family intramembrane serine protease [Streptantibioticus rubrisoli]
MPALRRVTQLLDQVTHRSRQPLPVVTYAVIGLCAVVFAVGPISGLDPAYGSGKAQLCAQALYFDRWGVIPSELWRGPLHTTALGLPPGCQVPPGRVKVPMVSVLTALFVHGGWPHLLGNMLFLAVFGAGVERRMGRCRYALFYLAAGYLATFGYALGHARSAQTLVGASGAIAGVLGGYLYLYPKARVTSLFPFLMGLPLRFPAWLVLGFWFVLQWLSARIPQHGPGVAYLAHVIGFAFGFVCTWAWFRSRDPDPPRSA